MRILLLILFISFVCYGQENIERFKIYDTSNVNISLLLDTASGKIWMVQIGLENSYDRMKVVLSDEAMAYTYQELAEDWNSQMKDWEENYNSKPDSIVSKELKTFWKPAILEESIAKGELRVAKNGRFKLSPTDNIFNFIMVDVIDGRTWQVQWAIEESNRLVLRIY